VLLIDAGGTLREGVRLRSDAARLLGAGAPVTHIALTHAHFDHVLGAAAFPGAQVYGAAGVGALLSADRAALRDDAVRYGVDARDADEALDALVLPQHEVDGEQVVELGGGVRAVLVNAGPGHTAHDLAVVIPGGPGEPGRPGGPAGPTVVFCGDLVEESGEPQAGPDAVPARWPDALDRLLALGGEDAVYVPGHGAAVDAAFVRRQRDELAVRFGVG
jgi:glyoxylase-like metal-dependent hydrolase (beta-lactamase superfamily II)